MKKLNLFLILPIFVCTLFVGGCTSGCVSLFITNPPNKIVYEVGEEVDFSGLNVEYLNTDGTTTKVFCKAEDFSKVDTSTPGEKTVLITKKDITTTFKIYVANSVVTTAKQLKSTILNSTNGDVIYIKLGEYSPIDAQDESLYNIVINKQLTIIGDGNDKTILHGNFLVGVTETQDAYVPLDNFGGVTIMNIGFKLTSQVQNGYNVFEGKYGNYDNFGAIKTYNSKDITIKNCSFEGYCYGINADNITNLNLTNNYFKGLKICGVKVTQNILNSTISKNVFIDIGKNSLVYENGQQGNVCGIHLNFSKAQNVGVIICNNNLARIGFYNGTLTYANLGANELEINGETNFANGFYVNNSALIILSSSTTNNLDINGLIFSNNNYGQTLQNISFSTTKDNFVNQNGVIII